MQTVTVSIGDKKFALAQITDSKNYHRYTQATDAPFIATVYVPKSKAKSKAKK